MVHGTVVHGTVVYGRVRAVRRINNFCGGEKTNRPIICHYLADPSMDTSLGDEDPNAAVVIGPIVAIIVISVIAVVLLVVYIRRRRSAKLKSSGMSGSRIVNHGQETEIPEDGMSYNTYQTSNTYTQNTETPELV